MSINARTLIYLFVPLVLLILVACGGGEKAPSPVMTPSVSTAPLPLVTPTLAPGETPESTDAETGLPLLIGGPVEPRPLPPLEIPQHPFLAEQQRNGQHAGTYNSEVNSYPGPLGYSPIAVSHQFDPIVGVAPNVVFDSKGRVIVVSIQLTRVQLALLDPHTLEVLAIRDLPPRASSFSSDPEEKKHDTSGGGYFHLDSRDRAIIGPANHKIQIFEVVEKEGKLSWEVAQEYDLSQALPENAHVHDAIPDWEGNIWFVTRPGILGFVVPQTGQVKTFHLLEGEEIENAMAVAEDGVYLVSTAALYRFEVDPETGEPHWTWREEYERGEEWKPGLHSHGSGTTPTLIGDDLIAIADAADPQSHVLVYKRLPGVTGSRLVCKVPVFEPGASATENSFLAYGNSLVVENDYGYNFFSDDPANIAPGLTRIDIRDDLSGCDVIWEQEIQCHSLPRLSTATGLLYFYTYKPPLSEGNDGGWYLTAVDFETGQWLFDMFIGSGPQFRSFEGTMILGPDGTAYMGNWGGLAAVRDGE